MKLCLNSENASNNIFTLDHRIKGVWQLISFCCTNNIYNVTENNSKIYFKENGIDLVGTLATGYYDMNDLETNISTAMNAVSAGTITVTVDGNTNKYTINDTLNYHFTFGTNTANSARKLVGMNAIDGSNAMSQTSDAPIDLNRIKNIFINVNENDDRDVFGSSYFSSSLVINGCQDFGEKMRYINRDNFDQFIKVKNTKRIELAFHDINNNSVDLNSDYQIIFQKIN